MVVSLATMVVLLTGALKEARARNTALREAAVHVPVGDYLPGVNGKGLDGSSWTIAGSGNLGTTVLYAFDTSCPYCVESVAVAKDIADWVGRIPAVRFIGLSLDAAAETQPYVQRHGFDFPVVTIDEDRKRSLLRIGATPVLLAVDSTGLVLWASAGTLGSDFPMDSLKGVVRRAINH